MIPPLILNAFALIGFLTVLLGFILVVVILVSEKDKPRPRS